MLTIDNTMVDLRGVTKSGDRVVISNNTAEVVRGGDVVAVVSGGKSTRIVSSSSGTSGTGTSGTSAAAIKRQEEHQAAVERANLANEREATARNREQLETGSAEVKTSFRSTMQDQTTKTISERVLTQPTGSVGDVFLGGVSPFQQEVQQVRGQSIPSEDLFVSKESKVAIARPTRIATAVEATPKPVSQLEKPQVSTGEFKPQDAGTKFSQTTAGRSFNIFRSSFFAEPTDLEPRNIFEATAQGSGIALGIATAGKGAEILTKSKAAVATVKGIPKFVSSVTSTRALKFAGGLGAGGIVTTKAFKLSARQVIRETPKETLDLVSQEDILAARKAGQIERTTQLVGIPIEKDAGRIDKAIAKTLSFGKQILDVELIQQTKKGQEAFLKGASTELEARGLEPNTYEFYSALEEARRQDIKIGERRFAFKLAQETISEVTAGAFIGSKGIKVLSKTKSFGKIFGAVAPALTITGGVEGPTQVTIEKLAIEEKPTAKELGEAALLGAGSSVVIGGSAAGFALSSPGKSAFANLAGQAIDAPFETIGDLGGKIIFKITGRKPPSIGFVKVPVIVTTPSTSDPVLVEKTPSIIETPSAIDDGKGFTEVGKPSMDITKTGKEFSPSTRTETVTKEIIRIPSPPVPPGPVPQPGPSTSADVPIPPPPIEPNVPIPPPPIEPNVPIPPDVPIPIPPVIETPSQTIINTNVNIPIVTSTDFLLPIIPRLGGGGGFSLGSKGLGIPRAFRFAPDLFSIATGATTTKLPKPGRLFSPFEQRKVVVSKKKRKKGKKKKR